MEEGESGSSDNSIFTGDDGGISGAISHTEDRSKGASKGQQSSSHRDPSMSLDMVDAQSILNQGQTKQPSRSGPSPDPNATPGHSGYGDGEEGDSLTEAPGTSMRSSRTGSGAPGSRGQATPPPPPANVVRVPSTKSLEYSDGFDETHTTTVDDSVAPPPPRPQGNSRTSGSQHQRPPPSEDYPDEFEDGQSSQQAASSSRPDPRTYPSPGSRSGSRRVGLVGVPEYGRTQADPVDDTPKYRRVQPASHSSSQEYSQDAEDEDAQQGGRWEGQINVPARARPDSALSGMSGMSTGHGGQRAGSGGRQRPASAAPLRERLNEKLDELRRRHPSTWDGAWGGGGAGGGN